MNIFEIVNHSCETKQILSESWQTLTEDQKTYLTRLEQQLWPLMESLVKVFEQRLDPQEIENIFSAAEKQHAGKKTAAGQAADLSGQTIQKINQFLDKQGSRLQETEPVKNFDQKAEQLKTQIQDKLGSDAGVIKQVDRYVDWAKQNPGKTAFVIGVLTAAAAFAGGAAGGAAVGFLLRSANELIKGESASTAVGKAAKTAAIGGLVGASLDAIGDALSDGLESVALEQNPDIKTAQLNYQSSGTGQPTVNLEAQAYGRTQDVDFIDQKFSAAIEALKAGDADAYAAEWSDLQERVAEINTLEYMSDIAQDQDQAETWLERTERFDEATDAIAATVQASVQEKSSKQESVNEAPKDVARRAGQKAKQVAQGAAKQTTQKVTKRKLMKAWEKQGKPLDTGSIANILKDAGLTTDEISDLGSDFDLDIGKPKKSLKKGATTTGPDGGHYEWKGAQWVNKKTGRVAKKDVGKKLSQRYKQSQKTDSPDLSSLAAEIKNNDLVDQTIQYLKSN